MGAGGLQGYVNLDGDKGFDLDDVEVEEVYETLQVELDKKLREIKVRKFESMLVEKNGETMAPVDSEKNLTTLRTTVLENRLLEKLKQEQPKMKIDFTPVADKHIVRKQLTIPIAPKTQVQPKALQMMGDKKLDEISREALPKNAKVTPKALKQLGEEKILPEKVMKRLGSGMKLDQKRAQKADEIQANIDKLKRQEEEARRKMDQSMHDPGLHEMGL